MSTYHPGGTRVKSEYSLNLYERNVQVVNLRLVINEIRLDRDVLLYNIYPEPGLFIKNMKNIDEHIQLHRRRMVKFIQHRWYDFVTCSIDAPILSYHRYSDVSKLFSILVT